MRGKEFWIDDEISFPQSMSSETKDGTYRTVFGPSVSHNAQIYSNTDHNFRLAMRRLTGKRCPETKGKHEQMFVNQNDFINTHKDFYDKLKNIYEPYFHDYEGTAIEALKHYADPHEKRLLRIQAHHELINKGLYMDSRSLWVKSVLWKLKKNEWAKPGKKPRSIGDLGVAASLLGFRLTHFLKTAQASEVIEHNGGHFVFCKSPDPWELQKHFRNLIDPPGRFYFLYFSDDACLSIRNPYTNKFDFYNLDISSCDASHGPRVFEKIIELMPTKETQEDMRKLVKQCQLPLKIHSNANPKNKIRIKPTRPMLYSGSTITTAINNVANLSIGLAISECQYTGRLDEDGVSQELVLAAESAGYVITGCKPLEFEEDIQFLKNSPVKEEHTGCWKPMLNFGVFLRASGSCNGDLPMILKGPKDLRSRAEAFQRGLLAGTYPYCTSELLDKLRSRAGSGVSLLDRATKNNLFYKVVSDAKFPTYRCDTSSFMRRYRLTDLEYLELLHDFGSMGYGEHYHGSSVSKILELDYGLVTTELEQNKYLRT